MKTLLSFILFAGVAFAQGNCNQSGSFTGTGRGNSFDNRTTKCDLWTLIAQNNNGFSGLSIEIDGAPDNQGAPGSWFSVLAIPPGSNPCTDINTCYIISKVAYPWMSVNVTSATGTGRISYRLSGVNTMTNAVTASSGSSGGGGTTVSFAAPYVTAGSSVFGPNWALTQPPLTGWTTVNGASLSTTNGYPYIHSAALGSTQIAGLTRTAPTPPWNAQFVMNTDVSGMQNGLATSGESAWALGFSDGTKYSTVMVGTSNSNACALLDSHWTNTTTLAGNVHLFSGQGACEIASRIPTWWKICDDGTTNILFQWSIDGGNTWVTQYTEARLSFLASVSNIFVGMYPNSGAVENAVLSYKTGPSCP